LNFRYADREGRDIFDERVKQVDVFVFDDNERLIKRRTITKAQLTVFAGTELNLNPGKYRVVAWANAVNKHVFSNVAIGNHVNDARLSHISGGEPLLYTPAKLMNETATEFTITVPKTGQGTETISFSRAHTKIEVYVIGFESRNDVQGELPMIIEIEGVSAHYNFEKEALEHRISFQNKAISRTIEDRNVSYSEFYTPLFEGNTAKLIHVKSADNTLIHTVNLREFLEKNADIQILDTDVPDMVIPVLITFERDWLVTVSVPEWEKVAGRPEY
jgi:hypothetical protein